MSNYLKINFFFFSIIVFNSSFANIHPYETTHLKSSGGTGVGSILLEESAFLNPASIAFFPTSSIYFQKDTLTTSDVNNTQYPKDKSIGFVLAQGDSSLAGTISYINQTEDFVTRKSWGFSLATPLNKESAIGISVRSSSDYYENFKRTDKYYQTVLGVSHSLNDATSLGILLNDPFRSKANETMLFIGVQHLLASYITTALDIGANYTNNELTKTILIRGLLQVKVLDDFYIRFGGFNDKQKKESGEGYGLAWIQPKLAFEFGMKNTTNTLLSTNAKTNKEVSFSISFRGN